MKKFLFILILFLVSFSTAHAQQPNELCFKDQSSSDIVYCFDKNKEFEFKVRAVYFDATKEKFSILPNMEITQLYVRIPRQEPQRGAILGKCVTDQNGECVFKGYDKFLTGTLVVSNYYSYSINPVGSSEFLETQQAIFEENAMFGSYVDAYVDDNIYLYLTNFMPNKTYYLIFYRNQENTPYNWQWTLYSNVDLSYQFSGFSTFGSVPASLAEKNNIENDDFIPFVAEDTGKMLTPTPEGILTETTESSNIGIIIFIVIILVIIILAVFIYYRIKKIDEKLQQKEE